METKLLVTAFRHSCTSGSLRALSSGCSLLKLSRSHDEVVDGLGRVEQVCKEKSRVDLYLWDCRA